MYRSTVECLLGLTSHRTVDIVGVLSVSSTFKHSYQIPVGGIRTFTLLPLTECKSPVGSMGWMVCVIYGLCECKVLQAHVHFNPQ